MPEHFNLSRSGTVSSLALMLLLAAALPARAFDPATEAAVDAAIGGEHRSAEDKVRDVYRKPKEVLDFLGFRSDMTVVEVWPGTGWYTRILAPALKGS